VNLPPAIWFLAAALASFLLAFLHGVNGQRSFVAPLSRTPLSPSPQWGDEDMTRRVFTVTWHMVTLAFGSCGVVLLLLAMAVLEGSLLPRFITGLHAAFIVLAIAVVGPRVLYTLRRPYGVAVFVSLLTVCLASWLGTR
jgi:hypothetical protein